MKRCCKCTHEKPLEDFAKDKRRKDGRHPECKECQKPRWKKYYREDDKNNAATGKKRWYANRELYTLRSILRKFKLTEEQYLQMCADADHKCSICGQAETRVRMGRVRRLCIDHDHTTGKVRGLLCGGCNAGLGQFKDNPALIDAAAAYLRKHKNGT